MANYINTQTNQYPVTERDIRNLNPNISLPAQWDQSTFDLLGIAPVFPAPQPELNPVTQIVREVAPILTDKGHYEQQWEVVSKFSEYTDDEGVVHTKEEQEVAALTKEAADKLSAALAALAVKRYTEETKGITFNRMTIPTDRQSQAMLTGAYNAVQQNPDRLINWKTDSGFVQLNKATIEALSIAVADHIQACFDNEMTLAAEIELDIDTDIEVGWPE